MLTNNSINSAINSNREMYQSLTRGNALSNKTLLTKYALAQNDQVTFYQDIDKQNKRKKIKRGLALGFAGLGAVTIGFIALFANKKIDPNKAKTLLGSAWNKTINLMTNLTNIKDDAWDKIAKKTENTPFKFIKNWGDKFSDQYRVWSNNKFKKSFDTALEELKKASGGQIKDLPENFDSWSKKIDTAIHTELHKENNKITDNLIDKNFVKNIRESGKSLFKKLTDSNIADTKINKLKEVQEAAQKISVPENASEELKQAIEKFNAIKTKSAEELVPKFRDISAGNAPTDALTILASMGMLGGSVALADNKEERKSMVLNLGIPLLTTIGMAIFGTARCWAGAKSLLCGFAAGQIASIGAKIIDKTTSDVKKELDNLTA